MSKKKTVGAIVYHVLVAIGAFIMVYPLLWMILSSFKPTNTILATSRHLIPTQWTLDNYRNGWKGFMGYTFATFFKNSFFISLLSTFGTLISSAFVAYALQRLQFKLKRFLFILVLATMMLPPQIMMIPQYMWFRHLGWVGTFNPMIVPYFFAIQGFFVYLIMNFIGGVPKELDEAAKIDGCSYYGIFFRVILPLITPALITSAIFSFIWRWDDYLSALLYVTRPEMRPISLALKLFNDPNSGSDIGATLAMSTLSILPATILFLIFQKSLVEGIASSGIKG
ncbi:carbohydrate ABC transporter permease [Butyrivibrio proteoclasticus]|uniref:carbohydrate ABC transporter permease n=1 Tax=Butyrivibrio proteoclasticus TaxID=43305 RepID=UPI00047C5A42|nr:carbohydrate ABC transporter permease [Butyrivibrio proteoclasticus]